jgi:aspartate kinase
MHVLKFGGTSVKDAAAIARLIDIVRRARELAAGRRSRPYGPIVVVSALSKVTDALLTIAARASDGDTAEVTRLIEELRRRHYDTAAGVVRDRARRASLVPALDGDLAELATLAHALVALRDASPRLQDAMAAIGELLSSRIVAAALEDAGLPARWVDAREVLITDASTPALPNMELTRERCAAVLQPLVAADALPVLGGFIGATASGVTTTLGRGGSDYSASIFGVCTGAAEIQIWTDVDGMLTADPRVIEGTRTVAHLSFDEASELAYFGAKVLHPSTIIPAVSENIPVRILNSTRPDVAGTLITAQAEPSPTPLTAIACKRPVTVIDIVSTRMLMAHGFLRRLFEVFERHHTAVDVVTTSEVSVSVTIDDRRRLDAIVADLSTFAEVSTTGDMALVCAVGEHLRSDPALCAHVVGAFEGLPLRMVSQAGSRRNITVVLPQEHLAEAVSRLHGQFCLVDETVIAEVPSR